MFLIVLLDSVCEVEMHKKVFSVAQSIWYRWKVFRIKRIDIGLWVTVKIRIKLVCFVLLICNLLFANVLLNGGHGSDLM